MDKCERTRLAPSPTGALHLGNARTFLVNWAMARQRGWRVLLRIEDLDGPRTKSWAVRQAIEVLQWLGLDWDEGPLTQCADLSAYLQALDRLGDRGWIYPCTCRRADLRAAQSAPNAGDHELRYPGRHRPEPCRPVSRVDLDDPAVAWRLRVPDQQVCLDDRFAGRYCENVYAHVGDFIVASKAGLPSYQLAVVVDDARQGVTQVVRGDDLLSSAARQLVLYDMLQLTPVPQYTHLPLVLGADGRRLAKRHGDTRLNWYRQQSVAPERIIALLGRWCGLGRSEALTAVEFVEQFKFSDLPRAPVVFTDADHQWLLA